jgi:hypothetical protein
MHLIFRRRGSALGKLWLVCRVLCVLTGCSHSSLFFLAFLYFYLSIVFKSVVLRYTQKAISFVNLPWTFSSYVQRFVEKTTSLVI